MKNFYIFYKSIRKTSNPTEKQADDRDNTFMENETHDAQ